MYIKKLGHCCLLIKTNGVTILTDPGAWSSVQNEVTGVDIILITHEHPDHYHIDSLRAVLGNNPNAKIITNTRVGELLEPENIPFEILEHGNTKTEQGVFLEAFGEIHEEIYEDFGRVQNTGYFIDNTFFYPGDAFTNPGKHVEILAIPVAGPWAKVKEAIDYALSLKPRVCFPVHDGGLKQPGVAHRATAKFLPENGIEFVAMLEGDEKDF